MTVLYLRSEFFHSAYKWGNELRDLAEQLHEDME